MQRQSRIAGLLLTAVLSTSALVGTSYAATTQGAGAAAGPRVAGASHAPATVTGMVAGRSRHRGLSGTWSGGYSGTYGGTFKFSWRQSGSKLIGHITLMPSLSSYRLTGTVSGGSIKFGTVGGPAVSYSGSVSGSSMSGTWRAANGHGSWHAHRS